MTRLLKKWRWLIVMVVLLLTTTLQAQAVSSSGDEVKEVSVFANALFNTLLTISIFLLIIIIGLAQMLQGAARYHIEKKSETHSSSEQKQTGHITGILFVLSMLLPIISFTQESAEVKREVPDFPDTIAGLSIGTFGFMISVIFIELLVAYLLWKSGMNLLKTQSRPTQVQVKKKSPAFIEKINASVAIEQEELIMFDHEYDGIRELDNNLPPWWKYGFYLTILFACIYLTHYHVLRTGSLQAEEYEMQIAEGERLKAEYRKTAASLVDETNVTQLISADSLNSGKSIFQKNCVTCHKEAGQGDIGPNLTDDYWLHGGDIKSIFSTIKYGVTSKGMAAWQENLSPVQIQEVASYILALRGTNPPNPKAPEGVLYNAHQADTLLNNDQTKQIPDSIKMDTLKMNN